MMQAPTDDDQRPARRTAVDRTAVATRAGPYPRQRSNTWFLERSAGSGWNYRIFMLRELSAVFLAGYTAILVLLVVEVHNGARSFTNFEHTLRFPGLIIFNAVAFVFALLNSATWFQAVPKAMPIRRGEEKVPPALLIGVNYLAMLVLSALILILVLI